jgi:hypothetical protein
MTETFSDEDYAVYALTLYKQYGWSGSVSDLSVKLIHPEGRKKFMTNGVIFIDSVYDETHYKRFCVLLPNQKMRMHHHEKRIEVFKVIEGVLLALTENKECISIPVGGYFSADTGAKHSVKTNEVGCLYLGICHADHLVDVHWEEGETLVVPEQRATLVPVPEEVTDVLNSNRGSEKSLSLSAHFRDTYLKSIEMNQ